MARVVRIHGHGGPEALALEDLELPDPKPGQVRIRQRAIGINFIDTYHRTGLYSLQLPTGIGMEAAGVVEAVGAEVQTVSVGDRVGYAPGPVGAYAEARNLPADRLIPLPEDISYDTAAAVMLKGMTVEYLVRRTYPVRSGQTVLLHAAAGGVGLLACQWLSTIGAKVIGTVGTDEKAELARAHGCDHTIVYTRENFVDRVRELTEGKGVPVVYDSVGKATFQGSLDCLSPRGMLVGFGNASGKPEPFDVMTLAKKGSLYLTRPTLMSYTETRGELLDSARAVFAMVGEGKIEVEIGQRWSLEQVTEAHRALEARTTKGSSLLIP